MPYPSTVDSGNSNASVGTDGSAIPTSSTLAGASDGTNLQQLFVESATNRNLRAALYNGANEWAIDAGGKGSVKSATNDIVDLATLLALAGTSGDANTVNSFMGRFTKIRDLLITLSNITADYDTGAGTQTAAMLGLALPASGGAVAGGTSTNPVRNDPTGTTTQPVSGTVTANAGTGTFNIQSNASINNAQVGGTAVDVNSGNKSGGTQRVVLATDQPQLTNAWLAALQATTSGGSTPYHLISAATNNATSVKASAGQIYGITISNTNAAARFFKLYNKASAPAPATDNGLLKHVVQIPANATVVETFPEGLEFTTGIAFAAVVNISDTDNTSISASDLSIDLRYK